MRNLHAFKYDNILEPHEGLYKKCERQDTLLKILLSRSFENSVGRVCTKHPDMSHVSHLVIQAGSKIYQ